MNPIVELEITDIAFGGEGVGRVEGRVVFVPFTLVGERVEVEIVREGRQFARGRLVRVVQPSPERRAPRCVHYGQCAGCQYQHMPYELQCETKTKQVRDLMERIGRFDSPPVQPIVPSPVEFGYRSKITLHPRREGLCYVGLEGRPFAVRECPIAASPIDQAIRAGRTKASGRGDMLFRTNSRGELFLHDLSTGPATAEFVEQTGDMEFRLPLNSFFQNNLALAPRLLDLVRERVAASGVRHLIDAYCGAGFFVIHLARQLPLAKCWGIEIDPQAVPWARQNASRHGVSHIEFHCGAVESVLPTLLAKLRRITHDLCVLLDPPRAGCHPRALQSICRWKPRQVLYVSCDPSTLARDLRLLCDGGYHLQHIQPLDMFPQTAHIECLVTLTAAGAPPEPFTPPDGPPALGPT